MKTKLILKEFLITLLVLVVTISVVNKEVSLVNTNNVFAQWTGFVLILVTIFLIFVYGVRVYGKLKTIFNPEKQTTNE